MLFALRSKKGSLIFALIFAIVVPSALVLLWSQYQANVADLVRFKNQVERDLLESTLENMLLPDVCTCQLTTLIDPTQLEAISLESIRSGCDFTVDENKLVEVGKDAVTEIAVTNLKLNGTDSLTGNLVVRRAGFGGGSVKADVLMDIKIDLSAAGAGKPVTSCQAIVKQSGMISSCPTGYALVGDPGARSTFCISTAPVQGPYYDTWSCPPTGNNNFAVPRGCYADPWYRACKAGVFTPTPGSWEWTGAYLNYNSTTTTVNYDGFGSTMGGGPEGCESLSSANMADVLNFRCCIFSGL